MAAAERVVDAMVVVRRGQRVVYESPQFGPVHGTVVDLRWQAPRRAVIEVDERDPDGGVTRMWVRRRWLRRADET